MFGGRLNSETATVFEIQLNPDLEPTHWTAPAATFTGSTTLGNGAERAIYSLPTDSSPRGFARLRVSAIP